MRVGGEVSRGLGVMSLSVTVAIFGHYLQATQSKGSGIPVCFLDTFFRIESSLFATFLRKVSRLFATYFGSVQKKE